MIRKKLLCSYPLSKLDQRVVSLNSLIWNGGQIFLGQVILEEAVSMHKESNVVHSKTLTHLRELP